MHNMSDDNKLTIVTTDTSGPVMRGARDQVKKVVEKGIPLGTLRSNFSNFMSGLQDIFMDVEKNPVGNMQLDEVTFSVEIGADGEFKLVGTGVGVSASSSITFKLRRKKEG